MGCLLRRLGWAAFYCFSTCALAQTAAPTPTKDSRIEALLSQLEQALWPQLSAISPNGRWIAWTMEDGDIELAPLVTPTRVQRVTACSNGAKGHEDGIAWSPDSLQLAFFSDCGPDRQPAVYVANPRAQEGSSPRRLLNLSGAADSPLWSPDGRRIAFLYSRKRESSAAGSVEWSAGKALSGVIGEEPPSTQSIALVDVRDGALMTVSPPGLHVFEFDWAPDSRRLVYTAAPPPGENNWWNARMYVQNVSDDSDSVDARRSGSARILIDPAAEESPVRAQQLAVPRWSPDGKQIAFISGLMSDRGLTGGDIYLVEVKGGKTHNITPGRKASPAHLVWRNATTLEVAENAGGGSHLFEYDIQRRRESRQHSLTLAATIQPMAPRMNFSMSRNGQIGLILSSFTTPPEVWAGNSGGLVRITHYNDGLRPQWGTAESVSWQNDGFDVQGWLIYPRDYQRGTRYPMIVYVHGGPAYINSPTWPSAGFGGAPFSALGYFVFMPNPRGSFGQGERFTRANRKDLGFGDLRDILAGVDVVSREFPVDSKHVGLTGWSYGGYMTMFAVTQTDRFYAAVAGAGVSDWQSYYGESFVREWMPPYFGASVYDDPGVYARSSPMTFIGNAHTPTLLVVGNADLEAPVQQMMEFWNGLRYRGIDTRLVVYPDEGHHFVLHEHRRDVLARSLEWLKRFMPGH